MTTFYIITAPSLYGNRYAEVDDRNNYRCLSKIPTMFSCKKDCKQVIANYKWLSKNSGKKPSKMEINEINLPD